MGRSVTGPDGVTWRVARLVLPDALRPSVSLPMGSLAFQPNAGPSGAFGSQATANLANLAGGILLAIVLLVVAPVLVPLLIACRNLLRRPWWVQAVSGTGDVKRWRAVGGDESRRAVERIAEALGRGELDPQPPGTERVLYWGSRTDLLDEDGLGFYSRSR